MPEPTDFEELVDHAKKTKQGKNGAKPEPTFPVGYTAAELQAMDLPEIKMVVPGLIPEGVCILAGRAKLGKSWLMLGTGVAIACGGRVLGKIAVEQGDVLYLALEDGQRRLKSRMNKIMGTQPWPATLQFFNAWPGLGNGGEAAIAAWLTDHPAARMVVIDVFGRLRPRRERGQGYSEDYQDVQGLQALAAEFGVAIVLIHHQRKMEADDPLDTLSGTTGLGAAADGALILTRERGAPDATLSVISRDMEEEPDLAIHWDRETTSWILVGDAPEAKLSPEKKKIMAALRGTEDSMTPKEVSETTGISWNSVKVMMPEMEKAGFVSKTGFGRYRPINPVNFVNSVNSCFLRVNGVNEVNGVNTHINEGPCWCGQPGWLRGKSGWLCKKHCPPQTEDDLEPPW